MAKRKRTRSRTYPHCAVFTADRKDLDYTTTVGRETLDDENDLLLRLLPLVGGKVENITKDMAEAVERIVANTQQLKLIMGQGRKVVLPGRANLRRHELKIDIDRDKRFLGLLDIDGTAPQAKRPPGRPPSTKDDHGAYVEARAMAERAQKPKRQKVANIKRARSHADEVTA